MLPKGSIVVPDDLPHLIMIAALGLFLLLVYYLWARNKVAVSSFSKVVVPRWDPPEGVSPAVANYIDNKGFPHGVGAAMSAALLNLAVKGYVTLDDLGDRLLVHATDKPPSRELDSAEMLLRSAIAPYEPLVFDRKNGAAISALAARFRTVIERDHAGRYFKTTNAKLGGGLLVTLAALLAIAMAGYDNIGLAAVLMLVPLALMIGLPIMVIRRRGTGRRERISAIWCLIVVLGLLAFVGAQVLGRPSTIGPEGLVLAALVMSIVGINFVFAPILETWTKLGVAVIGQLDGLRRYLSLVDEARMAVRDDVRMSPQHFERLLPYAVALGVEKKWSEVFETWITPATGEAAGLASVSSYQPSWCNRHQHYHHHHGVGWVRDAAALPSAVAAFIPSTISSALTSTSASAFSGDVSSDSTGRDESSDDPPSRSSGSSGGGGGGGMVISPFALVTFAAGLAKSARTLFAST
ncbi:DUF2207 domain-containing protein [Rhizobium sp. BR 362]|uniref:DUF2207 domain-containing protein n=1 Tax=Rhizobium sp. BR 362 TaxID=3040670 RepID=UPI002F407102